MASESAIVSWMLALPAAGALAVLALPEAQARRPWMGARAVALAFGIATLIVAGMAAGLVDFVFGGMQLVHRVGDVRMLVRYGVGMDGIAVPLVLVTAALGVMACWASYGVKQSVTIYFALLLFWMTSTLGMLVALDGVLFLGFLLGCVVTTYFLIGGWGSDRKVPAARRFLYFSLTAVAVLIATIGRNDFSLSMPAAGNASWAVGFWGMLLGFGTLAAILPVHGWLADVLAEASTPVAMLVAAVVQMLGGYGMLRIGFPLFAQQAAGHRWGVGVLAAMTMAYGVLAAMGQKDLRRMAAYVSMTLMGFFLLGLAMGTATSVLGAGYLLVGHAVALALWVFVAGMVQDRVGHCEIGRLGGLGGHLPAFAGWSAVAFLAAMGMPGLCVFVGQLLVLMGAFERGWVWLGALGAAVMVVLMGCCVWTYQRAFLGAPRPEHSNVARMSMSERWILAVLGVAALGLGVVPMVVTEPMRAAVAAWCRGMG